MELTPKQIKLLEWLDNYGFLNDYRIEIGVQFESI